MSGIVECPDHLVGKECDQYLGENVGKEYQDGISMNAGIFFTQYRAGWLFAQTELPEGAPTPPDDMLKEKAMSQPMPLVPVSPTAILEVFKLGMEGYTKEGKPQ